MGRTGSRMLSALAVLAVVSAPSAALAQKRSVFINGNELVESCKTDPPFCSGFIIGAVDALEATGWPRPRTCRPVEVTMRQVLELAHQFLADNPARWHEAAFDLIADVMVKTWPCG